MSESLRRDTSEFYVGYLPVPPGLVQFVRLVVPVLIVAFAALAWLTARAQNDPGDGVWDSGVARDFVGRISAAPYPHIRALPARAGDPVETLWLVEVGKFGGGQRAAAFDGQIVRLSGWVLERDGRRMIEMEPGDTIHVEKSLSDSDTARLADPPVTPRGRVTLRGEIIDSKCFLGAMKPGEGKTHKECATLCIAGGIPPMFVTQDSEGRREYYLMTDTSGRGLAGDLLRERVLPFVADAVEVVGEFELRGDQAVLRLDPSTIQRL